MDMLNFRVDRETKEKIKAIQAKFFPNDGASDVQREVIAKGIEEFAKYDRYHKELSPNILVIAQKIDYQISLEVDEIKFLMDRAIKAYKKVTFSSYVSGFICKPKYLLDCLSIVEAIATNSYKISDDEIASCVNTLEKINVEIIKEGEDYNAIFFNRTGIDEKKSKKTITKLIQRIKENLPEMRGKEILSDEIITLTITNLLLAAVERNFYGINIESLNKMLSPYYVTLVKLAKRSFWEQYNKDLKSLIHWPDAKFKINNLIKKLNVSKEDKNPFLVDFQGEHSHIKILKCDPLPIGLATFIVKNEIIGAIDISGPRFFKFLYLFINAPQKRIQNIKTDEIELYNGEGHYGFVYLAARYYLTLETVEEIKSFFKKFVAENELFFEEMFTQIGDI